MMNPGHRLAPDGLKCLRPASGEVATCRVTVRLCAPEYEAIGREAMSLGLNPSSLVAAILRRHLTGAPLTSRVRPHEPNGHRSR